MSYELHHGDCLSIMPTLAAHSFDAVIADIPSGRTACVWDSVIPFEPMWEQLKRVTKPRAAIVLLGCTQPFTSALVMSNPGMFRYEWVWDKVNKYTGSLNANRKPLRRHEDVLVFATGLTTYNKQYRSGKARKTFRTNGHGEYSGASYKGDRREFETDGAHFNPCSVLQIRGDNKNETGLHPTQKPLALLEYLVRTYTNAGDVVLDFTMGSGTCGAACGNLGRRFIGIERDVNYFNVAQERIATAYAPLRAMQVAV